MNTQTTTQTANALRQALDDVLQAQREWERLDADYYARFDPQIDLFGDILAGREVDPVAEREANGERSRARAIYIERSRFARTLRDLMDWNEARAIIDAHEALLI